MTKRLSSVLGRTVAAAFRTAVVGLAVYGGLDLLQNAFAQDSHIVYLPVAQAQDSESLESRVSELEELLYHFSRDGDEITISGANLNVVNGTGVTDGFPNSLGNVIIGYNRKRDYESVRTGSHMLVVGDLHNYSSWGGIVAGQENETSGRFSSAVGGHGNTASGPFSTVSGGAGNQATGDFASISGGVNNWARGAAASVTGGRENIADGISSTINGGFLNVTSGLRSVIVGGSYNRSEGETSVVSGGGGNKASGLDSSVSGGSANIASGNSSSVGGGGENEARGILSSVGGGRSRSVLELNNWRAGDLFQAN